MNDKTFALEVIRATPELASTLEVGAHFTIFTQRWTPREDYIKRQEDWLKKAPQNHEAAAGVTKRVFALKPRVGKEFLQARVNMDSSAWLIQIDPEARSVVHWEQFPYQNIERFIEGSAKITEVFGYWPSFHDAEVLKLLPDRGEIAPEKNVWVMPSLTVQIEHWEMTDEINTAGYFVLSKRTFTEMKFDGIAGLQMTNFNHQNAILGLELERIEKDGHLFSVTFVSAFGPDASFECSSIEVIRSEPKANT